jgi:hypothetical protein
MSRLTIGLALASSLLSSVAFAETQAEIAARENEEGKTLMFSAKYGEASEKFQNAVARVPEPKYFFNLCTSRFSEGKFGDALTACNAADKNGDDKLKEKTAKLVAKIREEAQKQGIDLQASGGGGGPGDTPPTGDPNNPGGPPVTDPNNPGGPAGPGPGVGQPPGGAVGTPPDTSLFQATRPENKYTWSVGIDLYGGGGKVGRSDLYGNSGGGVRLKADYLLNPKARFGAEGYFQFTHFGQGADQVGTGTGRNMLDIMDIGAAAYKHFCGPHARLCFTPLAGIQLALMSPSNDMDATGSQIFNYASLGVRLDGGIDYALGSRYEHVIGVHAGINLYTRAFSEPMDGSGTAAERGLNEGGRAAYLSFGYTYRFQTPFGSTPFVTLE